MPQGSTKLHSNVRKAQSQPNGADRAPDNRGLCRHIGSGATALLTDADKLVVTVAGLTALALGVYSAREGTRVAGRAFDRCGLPSPPVTPSQVLSLKRCMQQQLIVLVLWSGGYCVF